MSDRKLIVLLVCAAGAVVAIATAVIFGIRPAQNPADTPVVAAIGPATLPPPASVIAASPQPSGTTEPSSPLEDGITPYLPCASRPDIPAKVYSTGWPALTPESQAKAAELLESRWIRSVMPLEPAARLLSQYYPDQIVVDRNPDGTLNSLQAIYEDEDLIVALVPEVSGIAPDKLRVDGVTHYISDTLGSELVSGKALEALASRRSKRSP